MIGRDFEVNKLEQIKYHYETLMEFYPEKYVVKYIQTEKVFLHT